MMKSDLLFMNISWQLKDLELYDNQSSFLISIVMTFVRFITFVMAVIVHLAVYKVLGRLPGRAINQMIYPNMVSTINKKKLQFLSDDSLFKL